MKGIMLRRTRRYLMAVLALTLLPLAGGCFRGGESKSNETEGEIGVPVQVEVAVKETMAQTLTVTGTIKAEQVADVSAQVTAQVLEVTVREGDSVSKGEVLVRLDREQTLSQVQQAEAGVAAARAQLEAAKQRLEALEQGAREEERDIARSQLQQAESALRTAQADLERLAPLYEQGVISKQQLDSAQTAYDTAKANRDSALKSLELMEKGARQQELEAARKEVEAAAAGLEQAKGLLAQARDLDSKCTILSPLTGIVVTRMVEPGEITNPGMGGPLLTLADPSSVYFEATVPERVALKVRPEQRVEVTVQGNGDRAVDGRIERLVPVADPQSRDFLVRIGLRDGSKITKPGMFARGAVVVTESPDAVVVPKDALVEREGKLLAFVIVNDTAEQREVRVGLTDTERAEILSGIRAGETVVVVGAQGLQDGDPVQLRTNGGQ
ncbi:MAG: efflux RND transporter periplasmic adaptor subunit [Armatimonadetes bacterium]|nr:efflux RND transporter periplasmic adaptor subunit [Armatimonadota bacterium]